MKNMILFTLSGLCALAAVGGCVAKAGPEGTPEFHERAIIVTNGSSINGPLINGVNGGAAVGTEVYGRNIGGTTAGGSALLGLSVHGSELTSVRVSDGAILSGAALVGATFVTQTPGGSPFHLRINTASASASRYHAGSTVNRYSLSHGQSGSGPWVPVCGAVYGTPVAAVPLVSRWNYQSGVAGGGAKLDEPDWITFACPGYALYECVGLGYEPWTTAGGVALGEHHQACVRSQRADYCGNGSAHTVDGLLINVFDGLGIQADTETWMLESEWTASGARCLSRPRMPLMGGIVPDCAAALPPCHSTADWPTTLLVTEAP